MVLGAHTKAAGHSGSIYGISLAAVEPRLLATGSDDETVRLWEDAEHSGAWQQSCSISVEDPAMCVNFSPDSTILAAGTSGGDAHLYNVTRGAGAGGHASLQAEACLRNHPEEVYACEFAEALDRRLCTASDTGLFLWDLAAMALVQRCGPPVVLADKRSAAMPKQWRAGYLFSLRQQPGGGGLLAGNCSDGAVRMWSAGGGALQPQWGRRLHAGIAAGCAFTADGNAVLSISKAGEMVMLDIRQRTELARAAAPVALHGCCLLHDGTLAVCGAQGMLLLLDPTDLADGLQVAATHQTAEHDALYSLSTGGEGSPLVAGGEALEVPPEASAAVPGSEAGSKCSNESLFDTGGMFTNGGGSRVVFTNAATREYAAPRQAFIHAWNGI